MTRRGWVIAWLAYAVVMTVLVTILLTQTFLYNWSGPEAIVLGILTWGLGSLVGFAANVLGFALASVAFAYGGQDVALIVGYIVVAFIYASLQFAVIFGLSSAVHALIRRKRNLPVI